MKKKSQSTERFLTTSRTADGFFVVERYYEANILKEDRIDGPYTSQLAVDEALIELKKVKKYH